MSIQPSLNEEIPIITIKLLLLGQSSVGKTSLINRFTNHTFDATNNLLTIAFFGQKDTIGEQKTSQIVWDTAGQQKYRTLPSQYFRGIQGILLVYDITSGESFLRVQDWLQKVEQNCILQKLVITLVGNKIDLQCNRQIKIENALQFAKSKHLKFKQTSAKTSHGVEQMIEQILQAIIEKGGFEIKTDKKRLNLQQNKQQNQQSSCC